LNRISGGSPTSDGSPVNGGAIKNQLAAACYADHAQQHRVAIVENVQLATDTYRVRLECPELAEKIVPGQFLMIRLPTRDDPLLGRPFALYDTVLNDSGQPVGLDVVYLVVGKLTGLLSQCQAGDRLEVWGPLGNGFSAKRVDHLIMVAGGIGQTPFLALGRQFLGGRQYGPSQYDRSQQEARQQEAPQEEAPAAKSVTLCLGVRRQDLLAGAKDFQDCGIDLRISSDDGSVGHHGLVTELLQQTLDEKTPDEKTIDEKLPAHCRIASCGPESMMEAVAKIASTRKVPCEVSLETPMACGIGICFSCVVKIQQPDGDWDYKRTCVDGPVFPAGNILW